MLVAWLRRSSHSLLPAQLAGAGLGLQEGVRWYYGGQQQERQRQRRGETKAVSAAAEKKQELWAADGELFHLRDFNPSDLLMPLPNVQISNKRRRRERSIRLATTRLRLQEKDQESYWKYYMLRYQSMRDEWEKLYWDPPEARSDMQMRGRRFQNTGVDGSRELHFVGRQFDRMGGPVSTLNDQVQSWARLSVPQHYDNRRGGRFEQHSGNRKGTWVKRDPYNYQMSRPRNQYDVNRNYTRVEQQTFSNHRNIGWPNTSLVQNSNKQSQL